MNLSSRISAPVTNERIFLEEKIVLPDVTFHAKHDRAFLLLDAPKLDYVHIHDDYEIYLHLEGNGAFFVNNRLYPLRRGDVIFTRPGDVHVFILNEPCIFDHACLWLSPACGDKWLAHTAQQEFCPHLTFSKSVSEQLIKTVCRLADEADHLEEAEKLSLILQAVLTIKNNYRANEATTPSLPEDVQRIIDFINAEFRDIESIEAIAKRFNISPATLGRHFRRYIRLSPGEFIKAKRLSCAKKMLDSGATVTESCMESGFSNCSHFIAVFKKSFGETPYEYKQRRFR